MVRKLLLCLAPAMALSLAACSGSSTGSAGSTGQGAGSSGTTRGTTGNSSSGTTSLGGTTGVNAATSSSSSSSGGTTGASSGGTSAGADLCDSCSSDADCQSGHCDTTSHQCQTSQCAAGNAVESDCIDALNSDGSGCGANGSCSCNPLAPLCGDCSADTDCQSGHCDQNAFVCTTATCAGADLTACTAAGGDCSGGTSCVCPPPKHDVCDFCAQDSDCTSGHCDTASHQCQVTDCTNTPADNDACVNSSSFNSNGQCSASNATQCDCFPLVQLCGSCFEDGDCQSGHCDANQLDGECTTATCTGADATACTTAGGTCSGANCQCPLVALCGDCSNDTDCQSGHCDQNNFVCTTATCTGADATACTTAGGTCSGTSCTCPPPPVDVCGFCNVDRDCTSGHCDTAAHQCQVTDCLVDGGESGSDQFCLNSFAGPATSTCTTDGSGICACNRLGAVCSDCFDNSDCVHDICNQNTFLCDVSSCSTDMAECTAADAGNTCTNNSCSCN